MRRAISCSLVTTLEAEQQVGNMTGPRYELGYVIRVNSRLYRADMHCSYPKVSNQSLRPSTIRKISTASAYEQIMGTLACINTLSGFIEIEHKKHV